LAAHKVGPAIAAGCGTVLKPAGVAPLAAIELVDLLHEAGLPRELLSVVTGPAGEIGDVLVEDERVRMITFTGSAEVGWELAARAAKKHVSLAGGTVDGGHLRPTVLDRVPADARAWKREIFGPVLALRPFESLEEAIELANGTDYGLQAGIFTRDLATAITASERLKFGGVTVNEAPTFRVDQMPYGGTKESGNTREGPHFTVRDMTEER